MNRVTNFASDEEEDECKDKFFNCRYWALIAECTKNAANMHRICRKSCGICKSEPCEDMDPYCAYWASTGECKSNPVWMRANCKLACKVCEPEICMDRNEYCAEWASLGECSGSNREYMVTSCALSCSACQSDVIPTTTAPLGRQCYTCGSSLETSGDFCDDKLTGTHIYCKDPEDICLLEYADDYDISQVVDIAMGCNDGKYTDEEGGVLINNKQHHYLTCNTTKNCSPYWLCNDAVQTAMIVEACEEVKRKLQWENEVDKIHP
ncbi:putative tyrosinase-like protein tyr-3 [Orchesella cincta]|uniref:Putative tyrosinase-like protein tyr-3 n=1 Tax=Orchesella cincta TaxID=48709 RepID=A0A1D2MCS8_ORCCI|nr:putative tyrosinase-like protein tyr-3 [Orchesella cincta]